MKLDICWIRRTGQLFNQGKEDLVSVSAVRFISFAIKECNFIDLCNAVEVLDRRGTGAKGSSHRALVWD